MGSSELFLKEFQTDPEVLRRCQEMKTLLCPRIPNVKTEEGVAASEISPRPSSSSSSSVQSFPSSPCSGSSSTRSLTPPSRPSKEIHAELVAAVKNALTEQSHKETRGR